MVHAWHGRHCRSEWRSQCLGVSIAESQPPPRAPALVKPIPVLLVAWVLAGVGAVGGSILGSAAGKPGLFAGALVGGVLGVAAAVVVVTSLHWVLPTDRSGAFGGGMGGFGIAERIAGAELDSPLPPAS